MLELPRLTPGLKFTNPDGTTTLEAAVYWQQLLEAIEAHENTQDQLIADILAAQTAADAAQAAADTAQAGADEAALKLKIVGSATSPSVVLSATDAGADATITIAAHTRVYGDGTTLAVAGGALTGLAYTTTYWIYYDDPTTADMTPTYIATTNAPTSQPNYVTGRHFVAKVTTPASGGGGTSGGGGPPGGGGPYP